MMQYIGYNIIISENNFSIYPHILIWRLSYSSNYPYGILSNFLIDFFNLKTPMKSLPYSHEIFLETFLTMNMKHSVL